MSSCWLCLDKGDIQIRIHTVPCPSCSLGKFLMYNEKKKEKDIPNICLDCGELTTNTKVRCLPCHRIYQETEILCNDCGSNHHKAKYIRCFYCTQKKKLRG